MNNATTRPMLDVAAEVAVTIDGIFAMIDGWSALLVESLGVDAVLSASTIDPLVETFAAPAVSGDTLLTGAGFVATPGGLDDAEWHLAWWLRNGSGARRLATIDDPTHEQFRDYTALEWWRVPAVTRALHLTGPYVDYVCTDDYTVTVTSPVFIGGEMIGVVGADALVDRLEHEILPVLHTSAGTATVVNASGRVVTSTDAHREPGSILRLEGLVEVLRLAPAEPVTLPGAASVIACGDTSLALVVEA
ncbi:cache domain-containing protein (plasmid) [Coraliomargarita sp. W4R53]